MSEVLEYIDSYFNGQLTGEERTSFEKRCVTDGSFAREVAIYISSRTAVKEHLLESKQKEWYSAPVVPIKAAKNPVRRLATWASGAIAAAVIVAVSIMNFLMNPGVTRMAKNYIEEKYEQVSLTMGTDSLALGKDAYNKKDYKKAEQIFTSMIRYHPDNSEALEMAGLVYFSNGNYDKAINYFGALAGIKGLQFNSGLFLKAITMIMRNAPGDMEKAKALLEEVVKKKLEGNEEAEKLLRKMD